MERYIRQLSIPEIGEAGQKKLAQASVLIVGAGGLGSPALYCLCCAGVGRIGIVDDDIVSESNLNRQFLHNTTNIGQQKTTSAVEKLHALNPDIVLETYDTRLTEENVHQLLKGYDIAMACVDNPEARQALNTACCDLGIPLINGGVNGMLGFAQVILPGKTPCIACLTKNRRRTIPRRTPASFAPVVSVISSLMAQCALLLLLGQPDPLDGQQLRFDGRTLEFHRVRVLRASDCPACSHIEHIE